MWVLNLSQRCWRRLALFCRVFPCLLFPLLWGNCKFHVTSLIISQFCLLCYWIPTWKTLSCVHRKSVHYAPTVCFKISVLTLSLVIFNLLLCTLKDDGPSFMCLCDAQLTQQHLLQRPLPFDSNCVADHTLAIGFISLPWILSVKS